MSFYYAMRGIITVVLFERAATGASLQIGDNLRANGDLLLILRSAPTTKEGSPKKVHPRLSNLPLGWVVGCPKCSGGGARARRVYSDLRWPYNRLYVNGNKNIHLKT